MGRRFGVGSQVKPLLEYWRRSLKLLLAILPLTGISFQPRKPSQGQTKECRFDAGFVSGAPSADAIN